MRIVALVVISVSICVERGYALRAWGTIGGNSTSIDLHRIDTASGQVSTGSQSGGSLQFTSVRDLAASSRWFPTLVWSVRVSRAVDGGSIASQLGAVKYRIALSKSGPSAKPHAVINRLGSMVVRRFTGDPTVRG